MGLANIAEAVGEAREEVDALVLDQQRHPDTPLSLDGLTVEAVVPINIKRVPSVRPLVSEPPGINEAK